MRIPVASCLLAALGLAAPSLATELLPTATSSTIPTGTALDDLNPSPTPFPVDPRLEIRQNLGVNPNAVAPPGQVPPVTVYSIVSQAGAVGAVEILTYTQLFVAVPNQFPAARQGTIGYGALQNKKRTAAPVATPITNTGIAGRIAWG